MYEGTLCSHSRTFSHHSRTKRSDGWTLRLNHGTSCGQGRTLGLLGRTQGLHWRTLGRHGRAEGSHRRTAGLHSTTTRRHWGTLRHHGRTLRHGSREEGRDIVGLRSTGQVKGQIEGVLFLVAIGVQLRITQFLILRTHSDHGIVHEVVGPATGLPTEFAALGLHLYLHPID